MSTKNAVIILPENLSNDSYSNVVAISSVILVRFSLLS
jgi:hypothetical protein